MKQLITVPELADLLRISRSKAYELIKEEGIVPLKLGPRSTRLTQEQVDSLMECWKKRD